MELFRNGKGLVLDEAVRLLNENLEKLGKYLPYGFVKPITGREAERMGPEEFRRWKNRAAVAIRLAHRAVREEKTSNGKASAEAKGKEAKVRP